MLVSFKVWVVIAGLIISSCLTWSGISLCIQLNEPQYIKDMIVAWGTYNGGVISAISVMREGFKISRLNHNGAIKKNAPEEMV